MDFGIYSTTYDDSQVIDLNKDKDIYGLGNLYNRLQSNSTNITSSPRLDTDMSLDDVRFVRLDLLIKECPLIQSLFNENGYAIHSDNQIGIGKVHYCGLKKK